MCHFKLVYNMQLNRTNSKIGQKRRELVHTTHTNGFNLKRAQYLMLGMLLGVALMTGVQMGRWFLSTG